MGGLARGAGDPLFCPRGAAAGNGRPDLCAPGIGAHSPPALRHRPAPRCPSAAGPVLVAPVPVAPWRFTATFPQQVETRQGARAGGGNGETVAAPLPPAELNGEIVYPNQTTSRKALGQVRGAAFSVPGHRSLLPARPQGRGHTQLLGAVCVEVDGGAEGRGGHAVSRARPPEVPTRVPERLRSRAREGRGWLLDGGDQRVGARRAQTGLERVL